MSYILMDESGDLGFDYSKNKTSKYFIVTFVFLKNKNRSEKMIKKIFKGFSPKVIKNHNGMLHAYKESPKTRSKLLNLINHETDINIISIYLNKSKVYTKLQDEKHVLYNYITNILLNRLYTKKIIPIDEKIQLIASRRETNKFLNNNFTSYLKNQTQNKHKVIMEILIKSPTQEKSLQVADMICWSIFRKYEHHDDSYYNLIKSKIVEENSLF